MSGRRHCWLPALSLVGLVTCGCHSFHKNAPATTTTAELKPAKPRAPVELPADEAARLCLATSENLQKAGQFREAILLLEKARQDNPRLNVSHRLAILYDRQGEFLKSHAEYKRAVEAKPNDADLHNDLGYSYYCRGMWDDAQTHLRKAVTLQPKHGRAWVNLGLALAQQGKYSESLEAFTKTVTPAQARCNLAFILTAQGKRDEARQAYREALALEPDLHIARLALDKLESEPLSRHEVTPRSGAARTARPEPVKGGELALLKSTHPVDPIVIDPTRGSEPILAKTPERAREPLSIPIKSRPESASRLDLAGEGTLGYVTFADDPETGGDPTEPSAITRR